MAPPSAETGSLPAFTGVTSTGVFCRPGCPAPTPRSDRVERFASARDALFAGYRPCLRCRPMEWSGAAHVTPAERRRAEALRPILAAARQARRRRRATGTILVRMLDTPLGPVLAGATDEGICLLEFTDRPMLPTQLAVLRRRLGRELLAGRHPLLERLERQLGEYFSGVRLRFDLPLVAPGSGFQRRVWAVLGAIPAGETLSYQQLAERSGRAAAVRAAGTANGANRLALLIPCHRVIRKSGDAGSYGGGRWRKEWLLAHEAHVASAEPRSGADAAPIRPDDHDTPAAVQSPRASLRIAVPARHIGHAVAS